MRDVHVYLLANATSIVNPYFLYFDIHLPYNSDIKTYKDNLILVQYLKNEEYRQAKKSSKFGKLISGTSFENYAVDNQFISDNSNFIAHKPRYF